MTTETPNEASSPNYAGPIMSNGIIMSFGSSVHRATDPVAKSSVPLTPAGYKILVKMYRSAEKSRGGIFIPQTTQADESVASLLCEVIELGPLCYKDPDKHFTGPWCKTGDIIIMKSYAGVRLQVGDDEYRLINDDSVDAVVTDVSQLSDIKRAY